MHFRKTGSDFTFAGVLGSTTAGFNSLVTAATTYFSSSLGIKTMNGLIKNQRTLFILEEQFPNPRYGPAWAETGDDRIHVAPSVASNYEFLMRDRSYQVAPLHVMIAHEVDHAYYGQTSENYARTYENRYRREMGLPLRDFTGAFRVVR